MQYQAGKWVMLPRIMNIEIFLDTALSITINTVNRSLPLVIVGYCM